MEDINLPKLSKQEQFELVIQARQGDKVAKDRLVMSCSGLVKNKIMQLVNENTWCYPCLNIIYDDLLNSGLLGVAYAFDKFDITKNTSFSSYAFFWISAFLKNQFEVFRKYHYSSEEFDESITDEAAKSMFDYEFKKILCKQLLTAVEGLEREVIVLFFGLDCRPHTLTEIAKKHGFSCSYASKLKKRALQKMKNKYEYALQCA